MSPKSKAKERVAALRAATRSLALSLNKILKNLDELLPTWLK
jgi:hypothetical protein